MEFASPNQYASSLEFCWNKKLLNQFLAYFKDKTRDVLKTIERNPVYFHTDEYLEIKNFDQRYNDFYQKTKTKKIPFKFKSQEVIFSQREFEVLSLLIKGKRICEIAKILQISPRSVETYLYNAKNKTNTPTVSRLLDSFADSLF